MQLKPVLYSESLCVLYQREQLGSATDNTTKATFFSV